MFCRLGYYEKTQKYWIRENHAHKISLGWKIVGTQADYGQLGDTQLYMIVYLYTIHYGTTLAYENYRYLKLYVFIVDHTLSNAVV